MNENTDLRPQEEEGAIVELTIETDDYAEKDSLNSLAILHCTAPSPQSESRVVKAGQQFVEHCARKLLRKLQGHHEAEFGELMCFGNIGLLQSVRRYDLERGIKFTTYAGNRIKGAMMDGLRVTTSIGFGRDNKTLHGKISLDAEVELSDDSQRLSLLDLMADPSGNALDSLLEEERERVVADTVRRILSILPPRHARVLRRYFFEDRTLREVADLMGVSESRVCQLMAESMEDARGFRIFVEFVRSYNPF